MLRFDLRLTSDCFCQQGLACDPNWRSYQGGGRICVDRHSNASRNTFWSSILLPSLTKWDSARFLALAADPSRREPCLDCEDPFLESEQAHAFFPFFPQVIRYFALCLIHFIHQTLLPPTFEAVVVLSALLINTVSFLVALVSLTELTIRLTLNHQQKDASKSLQVGGTVATLFMLNPASIFFSVSYSESIFAMLTFTGYALYYSPGLSFLVILPWMAASYTRSNGCLISAWLLLQGIAAFLQADRSLVRRLGSVAWHLMVAAAVVVPILIHDRAGDALHCQQGEIHPEWCESNGGGSFYSYVQRKHWNVGFLRYYELKQIPNFLLAAPILICSTLGVSAWIRTSWKEWRSSCGAASFPKGVVPWAFWALSRCNHNESGSDTHTGSTTAMLNSSSMLSHYAVLCVVALLGLTVAHVQITTRMICSTCPAIYWQLAHLCLETRLRRLIVFYLGIYIVVGTILHVNFLPWT